MTSSSREVTATVIHKDDRFLVLYKPTGMLTTSTRNDGHSHERCLVDEAAKLDPEAPRLHPSSRLDRPVTGLVVFARTREAGKLLSGARKRGSYLRRYLAIVAQCPQKDRGSWQSAIGIDPANHSRRIAQEPHRGSSSVGPYKRALTRFEVLSKSQQGPALLALYPETGRTHQLRVHCANAGLPIVGDTSYGGPRRLVSRDGSVLGVRRAMLHCEQVSITFSPEADQFSNNAAALCSRSLHASASLPSDFSRLANVLGLSSAETRL